MKQKIYLLLFTYLAFMPHTVFFSNIYWAISYFASQVIFGLIGASFLWKFKFDFKIAFPWLLLAGSFLFSLTGILFNSMYFEKSTITSYLNGIFLMLNSAIFFSVINSFAFESIKFWQGIFFKFLFVCLIVGILQYFGLINIEGARTSSTTEVSGFPLMFNRATSIFSEPSAWAHLYGIYLLLAFFLGYNWKIISIVLLSLLLSLSNSGFVFVALILFFSLLRKPITITKIGILVFFLVSLIGALIILQPYWDIVFSKFTDGEAYRNIAPLMVLKTFFDHFDIKMIFGHGIFSLKYITTYLDLSENIPTSHNSVVDILFELGFFGLICQLFLVFKTFRGNLLLSLLFIILLSQIGYRSYQFPFLFFIYSVYIQKKKFDKVNVVNHGQ